MPTLSLDTPVTEAYSGAAVEYTVDANGWFNFEAWGGGGGGGCADGSAATRTAGPGGTVAGGFAVISGDIIKVEVAQGGQQGVSTSGGAGGWPDGGAGGRGTSANIALGGGGGSTRIYKNNVLMAVAGGGGGTIVGRYGGAGGGRSGGPGGVSGANMNAGADGGTQSAGGAGFTAFQNGASLQGGVGYPSGGSPSTGSTASGGGGGGGYYGGGGAGGVSPNQFGAGGGGSSWTHADCYGVSMLSSGVDIYDSGNKPANVALGGLNGTAGNATAGGNGAVYLSLVSDLTSLSSTPTTVSYLGRPVHYRVPTSGLVWYELWGGGGGGYESTTTAGGTGGGGGNLHGSFAVDADDVITFVVGQGGRKGQLNTTGGRGGYPDGGDGGRGLNGTNSTTAFCGGGGGSTRIYKNGVLVAVAAGGAGAARSTSGQGGGLTGGNGNTSGQYGVGGSQSAGGGSSIPSSAGVGAFLQGGHGRGRGTFRDLNQPAAAGGGGGGGYYGGGGGGGSNQAFLSGGGGSSWASTTFSGYLFNTIAVSGVSNDSGHKPTNAGSGGTSGSVNGTNGINGYDGAAYVYFQNTELPDGEKIRFDYTGYAYKAYVVQSGSVTIKMWAAGGGGGYVSQTAFGGQGGGGGYTSVTLNVNIGDELLIYIGEGGNRAGLASTTAAFPDGGLGGGDANASSGGYSGGGGGGSSRVYKNGTLMAVAGGGGGGAGSYTISISTYNGSHKAGGYGGGLTGGPGLHASASGTGQGGTQVAGGTGNAAGASLQGGNATTTGGGGGGGYYGGGGGRLATTTSSGGGGGSSWISTDGDVVTGGTTAGVTSTTAAATAGNNSDPDYVAGFGVGGLGTTSTAGTAGKGGHGLAFVTFSQAGAPGDAEGLLATLTLTSLEGAGTVPISVSGSIGTLTATVMGAEAGIPADVSGSIPTLTFETVDGGYTFFGDIGTLTFTQTVEGEATQLALAEGAIGTITLDGNMTGTPTAEAIINIPFTDSELFLTWNGDTVAVGNVNMVRAMPGPLVWTAPKGSLPGVIEVEDLYDIPLVFTAPDAIADEQFVGDGDIGTLTLSVARNEGEDFDAFVSSGAGVAIDLTLTLSTPQGTSQDAHSAEAIADFDPALLTFIAPEADVDDGSVDISGDIGTLTFTDLPEFTYIATTEPFENDLVVEWFKAQPNQIEAFGHALAVSQLNGNSEIPGANRYLVRLVLSDTPTASGYGQGAATGAALPQLQLQQPTGDYIKSATILASIIPAYIRLIPGTAFAGPANAAVAPADLDDLFLTFEAPEGYVFVDSAGWAPLRLKRSTTPGAQPVSLEVREIAVNEADGILYTRDASGSVVGTPLAAIQAGGIVPSDGETGQFLRGDGTLGVVQPVYDQPVRLVVPPQNITLSEAVMGAITTSITSDKVYYHPFFIPKATKMSNISVKVATAANASVYFGICTWDFPQVPDVLIISANASTSTTGLKTIPNEVFLRPGWYAAMVAVTGAGTPELYGYEAPLKLSALFTASGDPIADFTGNFNALITPTTRASTSIGFVTADISNE